MNSDSTVEITVFTSVKDNTGSVARTIWPTFVDRTTNHRVGPKATKLIAGALFCGTRAQKNVLSRTCYLLDIETNKATGEVPPDADYVRAEMQKRGWAGVIYSTHSHTQEAPRYRVALPPETAIDINQDQAALAEDGIRALGLAAALGLAGVVDGTKLGAESMFYLPTHAPDAPHFGVAVEGRAITAAELAEALEAGKRLRADEDQYQEAAQEQRPARGDSVIAAYNASVTVAELLERHGYKRRPRSTVDWRSKYQTSEGTFATRVIDARWVTLSASDIAAGLGRRSASGVAASGDAFDLYCHYEHRGDQRAAMRAAAKALGLDAKKPASDEWADAGVEGDGQPDIKTHPLAVYVPALPDTLVQPRWIIPGLVAHGLVVWAGQHGVGKTTVLASIVATVAGANAEGDVLAPKYGRHVVYISEDIAQFQRIMHAVARNIPGAREIIRDRIHLVDAVRLPIEQVAKVGKHYVEEFTLTAGGITLPPLVVIDTRSAVIAVDDENDNAETSKVMAALKQNFSGLPIWIIGHIAKASFGRADAKNMSARGATAIEGDANQVVFIVIEDDDERLLVRGKTRFEASVSSCRLVSHVESDWGVDEFGDPCEIPLRYVTVEPLSDDMDAERRGAQVAERARTKAASRDEIKRKREEAERTRVLDFVRHKAGEGVLMGKTDAAERMGGRRIYVLGIINELLADKLLVHVPWPSGFGARGPRDEGYLVALNEHERMVFETTGNTPEGRK